MLTFLNDFSAAHSLMSPNFVPYISRRFTPNKSVSANTRALEQAAPQQRTHAASEPRSDGQHLPRFREIARRALPTAGGRCCAVKRLLVLRAPRAHRAKGWHKKKSPIFCILGRTRAKNFPRRTLRRRKQTFSNTERIVCSLSFGCPKSLSSLSDIETD